MTEIVVSAAWLADRLDEVAVVDVRDEYAHVLRTAARSPGNVLVAMPNYREAEWACLRTLNQTCFRQYAFRPHNSHTNGRDGHSSAEGAIRDGFSSGKRTARWSRSDRTNDRRADVRRARRTDKCENCRYL